MPSHCFHDSFSLALAVGLLYAGVHQGHLLEGALLAAGAASALILSPDLDNSYSMARLRLTRRGGLVAQAWWMVYDHLFRHRGLSHTPVIGTLTRLTWLVGPLAILAFLCYLSPPPVEWPLLQPPIIPASAAAAKSQWQPRSPPSDRFHSWL